PGRWPGGAWPWAWPGYAPRRHRHARSGRWRDTVGSGFRPRKQTRRGESRFARSGFVAHASSGPPFGVTIRWCGGAPAPLSAPPSSGRWSASTPEPGRPHAPRLPARRLVSAACWWRERDQYAAVPPGGDKRDKAPPASARNQLTSGPWPHGARPAFL